MNSTRALETSIQAVDPVSTPCGAGTAGSGTGALAGVWANVTDVARSNRAQAAGTHQRVQPGRRSWSIAVSLPMGRRVWFLYPGSPATNTRGHIMGTPIRRGPKATVVPPAESLISAAGGGRVLWRRAQK